MTGTAQLLSFALWRAVQLLLWNWEEKSEMSALCATLCNILFYGKFKNEIALFCAELLSHNVVIFDQHVAACFRYGHTSLIYTDDAETTIYQSVPVSNYYSHQFVIKKRNKLSIPVSALIGFVLAKTAT